MTLPPKNCRCCRKFILPLVLAAAGAAALAVDVPTADFFHRIRQDAVTRGYPTYLNMFEPFGHGAGVLFILLMLHQLDRGRRWAIPRLLGCAFASGGAANLLKLLVIRFRPHNLPEPNSVWDTFQHWLPLISGGSGQQSFPSAHAATAAGLAAGLIWLYPQGRFIFIALVALVGCQRIAGGAHYPSDVLVGAAVGCLVSSLFLNVGLLPGWMDRLERWWRPAERTENGAARKTSSTPTESPRGA